MTMHSTIVRFAQTGDASVLQFVDEEVRQPGADEVLIRVRAIGLNRAEIMMREGAYIEQPQLPSRLGYEASGTVEAVGDNVTSFQIGQRVSTVPAFSMSTHGVYGEYATVPARAVAAAPENLSDQEATSVWMPMITAYGALIDIGLVSSSHTVLITAASSSVGVAAIQMAKMMGATVIATTRGPEKHAALHEAGADHVVNTDHQNLVETVDRLTDGEGAHFIFDPIGGPILDDLAAIAAKSATIVEYGALDPRPTPYPLFAALQKGLKIIGYTLFEVTQDTEKLDVAKTFVLRGLQAGKLRPVIDKEFPFAEIQAAHRYMEAGQHVGKIVVTL